MATVLSFVSQKGGVGKTMCATNVAAALSLLHRKRVCLLDLDEQASAAAGVGVRAPEERLSLREAILERRLVDLVFQSPIPGLCAIPADPSVNELYFAAVEMKERLIELTLPPLEEYFDWIVIDTPSGLGLWSWNAVYVSDIVVTPVQADEAAERGLRQTIEWVRSIVSRFRPGVTAESLVRVVMTIVDRDNRVLNDMLREFLHEELSSLTLPCEIRKRAAACQARTAQVPILEFLKRDSTRGAREAASDFSRLTKEIVAYEKEERAPGRTRTKRAIG